MQLSFCTAQIQYEREHRIRKAQFPENAHEFIAAKLEGIRRLRYYVEVDSSSTTFSARFKKDRLQYRIAFKDDGSPEIIGVFIKIIDIPNESLLGMYSDLEKRFDKYRIRCILQQYPDQPGQAESIHIRNAFQNLLLPTIRYELLVAGKKGGPSVEYSVRYDAEGNFLDIGNVPPANYDRVLY